MKAQDIRDLAFVAHELAQPDLRPVLRRKRLAEKILRLFRADFLGQTQWNSAVKAYEKPICYNRDEGMSVAYECHYQHCDPISKLIRHRRLATPVYEVIPRREIEKTEYHADFLRAHDVSHGMDLYLYDRNRIIGDLRIWRRAPDHEFSRSDKMKLDALKPMLINAYRSMKSGGELENEISGAEYMALTLSSNLQRHMFSPALLRWIKYQYGLTEKAVLATVTGLITSGREKGGFAHFSVTIGRRNVTSSTDCAYLCWITPNTREKTGKLLTAREKDVLRLLLLGFADKEISNELGISFWTIRTHVGRLFAKLGVRNRIDLMRRHTGQSQA